MEGFVRKRPASQILMEKNANQTNQKKKPEEGETNINRNPSWRLHSILVFRNGIFFLKSEGGHAAIYYSPADYGHFRVQL